jgi:hypothetical protein
MQDFEKLGAFYLGKVFDGTGKKLTEELLLYDSKDLTTHAVCVGMTGSGKTGLCISLLEEAAIDGIPAIAIDPKGDLGNLLLMFPNLAPADFRPWIDEAEALRKGLTPEAFAAKTAELWKQGLSQWGQGPERIAHLKSKVDIAVYTPGSQAGLPLTVLRSFDAPAPEILSDATALKDRILSTVSGLLSLVGIEADPVQSREHILISNILDRAWHENRPLDLPGLIHEIQNPPFEKVGIFELESFFPSKERFGLAMRVNNLLASPGFTSWLEGESVDLRRLLHTTEGKPRLSVISIAHLSDSERMFFMTVFLNEVLSWMRAQPGTGSLRALLYIDEIFGYFPPTANPPSKIPMLTLLKQARAFGLGIVLATQNPVDLDYKGLANTGTWFIGRLQTERDKTRLMDGLESASGSFDRQGLESLLSGLGNRVFFMRNVHDDKPVLFQTRWALSYLRGPMTLPQIEALSAKRADRVKNLPEVKTIDKAEQTEAGFQEKPLLPPEIQEFYLRQEPRALASGRTIYRPQALGLSKLHFIQAKAGIDCWRTYSLIAPISEDGHEALWEEGNRYGDLKHRLERNGEVSALYSSLPAGALKPKNHATWEKTLLSHLYQFVTLEMLRSPELKLVSQPEESEGDFKGRITHAVHEMRDRQIEKLRQRYGPKLSRLQERIRRAEDKLEREEAQVGQQKMQTAISVGATVLGALFGRRVMSTGTVGRATTAMRGAGRIAREKDDVKRALENLEALQQQLADLQEEFDTQVENLHDEVSADLMTIETFDVRPRKSDTIIQTVAVVWTPWRLTEQNLLERLY